MPLAVRVLLWQKVFVRIKEKPLSGHMASLFYEGGHGRGIHERK